MPQKYEEIIARVKRILDKEEELRVLRNQLKTLVGEAIEAEEAKPKLTLEEKCPKCENKEAYFWTVQTRAGDEAETMFLECKKCKHRWRSYKNEQI